MMNREALNAAGDVIARECGEYTSFTYRNANEEDRGYQFGCFVYAKDDQAFHGYGATLADALDAARMDRDAARTALTTAMEGEKA